MKKPFACKIGLHQLYFDSVYKTIGKYIVPDKCGWRCNYCDYYRSAYYQ